MKKYLIIICLAGLICGCSKENQSSEMIGSAEQSSEQSREETAQHPQRLTTKHLLNPVQLHSKVISGGLPEEDAAFQELQSLGVKTIVSVDGAKPDVDMAQKYGLRYVHLPHGYDGIPEARAQELAKAVRDLEGPIYIHCHHGKHRSPAAASVACVTAGLIPSTAALEVLQLAGTNPNYRGLYQSAAEARPLDAALLDTLQVEFQQTQAVPPMAEAMVALEHTHDHLKQIAQSAWKTPSAHPDLTPAHEALLLREHFTELLRTEEVQSQPVEFKALLGDSEQAARELETALSNFTGAETISAQQTEMLDRLTERITTNCKTCHHKFRDTPLSEKSAELR